MISLVPDDILGLGAWFVELTIYQRHLFSYHDSQKDIINSLSKKKKKKELSTTKMKKMKKRKKE